MNATSLVDRLEALSKSPEEQSQLDPTPPDGHYFSRLGCGFTDSDSVVNIQYAKEFKHLASSYDPAVPLRENVVLRRALRLVSAHKVLMTQKVRRGFVVAVEQNGVPGPGPCAGHRVPALLP